MTFTPLLLLPPPPSLLLVMLGLSTCSSADVLYLLICKCAATLMVGMLRLWQELSKVALRCAENCTVRNTSVMLIEGGLGARLRSRTTTHASKKGSEKVLGRVLGKGS